MYSLLKFLDRLRNINTGRRRGPCSDQFGPAYLSEQVLAAPIAVRDLTRRSLIILAKACSNRAVRRVPDDRSIGR